MHMFRYAQENVPERYQERLEELRGGHSEGRGPWSVELYVRDRQPIDPTALWLEGMEGEAGVFYEGPLAFYRRMAPDLVRGQVALGAQTSRGPRADGGSRPLPSLVTSQNGLKIVRAFSDFKRA